MKKQLLIITCLATMVSFSAFSQGYITFTAGANTVKNGVTGANQVGSVAFLFAPVGTADTLGSGTPTSGLEVATKTWADVMALMSGGWTVGSVSGAQAVGTISGAAFGGGSFSYNGGASFAVDNWTAGTSQSVIAIGWYGNYVDIASAAAGNADLGWSSAFTYASGANASDPNGTIGFTGQASPITAFGIAPIPVPEPGTMALAALGGASLLLFRRRK